MRRHPGLAEGDLMSTEGGYRYSHTVGFFASSGGRGFAYPFDLVLGHDGVLYVLNRASPDNKPDTYRKRVTLCTVDEEYLGQFGNTGTGDGQMMWPVCIALDEDENVYVSDEALQRISIFKKEGQFLEKWGVKGHGDGEFDRPAGIAFDKEDNLLVADALNSRVQKFTKDGRFLGGWGRPGSGDGELNMPWGIAIDQAGDVYVADWRNDRIQKFDAEGKYLTRWGTTGQGDGDFNRPSGVAVDHDGSIYVADWGNERVQLLGPDGSFRAKLRGESMLSKWSEDYFVANKDELEARQESDLEPELDPSTPDFPRHQSAAVEKFFWGPTSVKVDDQGRVYVVDSRRHRIQIYRKEP